VVLDVLKEYNAFIFKCKEVPEEFQTQHGWRRGICRMLLVGG
jgi:hypothetical protein